ncbi:MAG: hypothetical protein DME21_10840 [Verrucomicrobia bacterium]|nr:MAG: hypothetical protein DME21_10840 [Verrucomicrobiota bacterium]
MICHSGKENYRNSPWRKRQNVNKGLLMPQNGQEKFPGIRSAIPSYWQHPELGGAATRHTPAKSGHYAY